MTYATGNDCDGDGLRAPSDCPPFDGAIWSGPANVIADLTLTKVSGATLSWAESASPGATIPVDDDRRSATPNGFMTATGLDSNQTGTVRAEATAAAPVFYHVVRVADSCGSKGGTDSADVDIPATTCP